MSEQEATESDRRVREHVLAATTEAMGRYRGDVDVETGACVDDYGYSAAERQAFVAGAVWERKAQAGDIASEIRLLRHQVGELARVLTQPGYPYDPYVEDEVPNV